MTAQEPYFGETHGILRASVARFVEREIRPFVDDWERAGAVPREVYAKAGAAGILGAAYPEAYGGSGGDLFHKVVVGEEIMRAGSGGVVASLGSLDIALPPLLAFGSEELKARIVPPVLRGERIASLAVTEPGAGSDVAGIRTRAVREGDHYRVTGSKLYVTSGVQADCYTVAVRTGGEGHGGLSLLLVERDTAGLSVGRKLEKMGWHASDTAEVFFDDCRVPAGNLIGEENLGFRTIMTNFQSERLQLCVMANMTSELALAEALRYVKERRAFGRELARFQVIRHKLADMAARLEASRELTYRCVARLQAGEHAVREVSMAKNVATDASDFVTREAVQIFGGMGFMRESLVERLYRDNRLLSIGGGTREIMNEIISRELGL